MVQGIADRLRGRATARQTGELRLEPGEQRLDQRLAPRLANGVADLRRLAADLGLDGVERGDALRVSAAIGAVLPFANSTNSRRTWLQQNARVMPSLAAASVL
jgi:hypothetical protein